MFLSLINRGWVPAMAVVLSLSVRPVLAQEGAAIADEAAAEAAEAVRAAEAARAAAAGTPAATPPDDVRLSDTEVAAIAFQGFCNEWLEKLVQREEQNVAHIQWVTTDIGVRGTFVGYSRNGQCETKTGTDAVPIGKLIYKQITYEKKGATVSAAEISAARPLDVAEVTEIFHYAGGKWIY